MKTIRFLRREAGLTQIELANLARVPRHKIQLHEQGLHQLPDSTKAKIIELLERLLRREPLQLELFSDEDQGGING